MHHLRIPNRTAQANEPKGFEEGASPHCCPTSGQTSPRALHEQAAKSSLDVLVDVSEMVRRIPRAKVPGPSPGAPDLGPQ